MIVIDKERCSGCGACLAVCPTGALYLVDGMATVDDALCRECAACLDACPRDAIALVATERPVPEPALLTPRRTEAEIRVVDAAPAAVSTRARLLPIVGTALMWGGREILPLLAARLLDALSRRATPASAIPGPRRRADVAFGGGGGCRQRRRRHRGRRAS